MKMKFKHGFAGFTLIEVLIAVLVLAVALGASLQAIGNHVRFQTILGERYQAHLIAWNALMECYVTKRLDEESCEDSGFVSQKKVYWDWEADDQRGELVLHVSKGNEIRTPLVLRTVKVYSPDDERRVISRLHSILKN